MNLHVRLGSYTLIFDLIFKTKCDKNKTKGEFSTMKLKRIKFYHVFTLLITTIIGFIYGNEIIKSQATFSVRGGILNEYNLELNNTNKPFVQDDIIVNHEKYTSFQYSKAIIDGSSNHVILDKNGLITNITPITGLTRINIQFSTLDSDAKLFLYFGKNVLPIFNEIEIISGNDTEITIPSDYLVIQSQFGRISIESVNIIYACTQDELEHKVPKLYINTEKDSHGNHIIPTNKVDYINSQIYLVDEKNSENNMGTLSKPLEAGIRLRGNSTMNKPKKPYRIKFDKKQAPFGLPKNKNWVLLAEYMDASSLHNYSAYSFAQQLDGFDFAPSTNFVEVILNGNSQGLYLFSDHVQAKAGRVDIEHDEEVFAPDKTVLQSLKEIITFDKSLVVPPEYARVLDSNIKFHFLDDTGITLNTLDNSNFNIIISNTQKIILKKQHKEKSAGDKLFSMASSIGDSEIQNVLLDIYGDEGAETEKDLIYNQRYEKLTRLSQLGIYVDEAHHMFGAQLQKSLRSSASKTSLRNTINELSLELNSKGTSVVACYNFTGTPYIKNTILPEVVYAYGLSESIENNYLKEVNVKGFENVKNKEFLKTVIEDFWITYGENRYEGLLPKLAIFGSRIEEIENEVKPVVEEILEKLSTVRGQWSLPKVKSKIEQTGFDGNIFEDFEEQRIIIEFASPQTETLENLSTVFKTIKR